MANFRNLKFKSKLSLLIGIAVSGLVLFGIATFSIVRTVKINGDLYHVIAQGNEIVADYIPPAESISHVVAYLVKMEEASSPEEAHQFVELLHQAHKDFDERHAYYMKTVPEGKMKDLMASTCYTSARQWFEIAEGEFVPLVLRG